MKISFDYDLVVLKFDTRQEMNLDLYRIQEYYESPYKEIKGKYFTFEQFVKKYSNETGLDYFVKWGGCNFPADVAISFSNLFLEEDKLSKTEQTIFDLAEQGWKYFIAYVEGDEGTTMHEMSHYHFFSSSKYRNKVKSAIKRHNKTVIRKMKNALKKEGYTDSVLDDEINAYMIADQFEDLYDIFYKNGVTRKEVANLQKELYEIQ